MMLEAEKKFLVFAHHLTMLQACTEAVIEAKVGYIRIDGSVPSSERIQLVHKFQNDPETRVAVLSIQAAGQGLTFTAASHVVFAELYWNPGHIKQAEDRAHRIGQTSSINVHYLIAKGTFDTVMWSMLNRKETVTGTTLNGKKEYLKAAEGDKDKWEFLNFADAWTPSEKVLPLQGGTGKDDVFFTHVKRLRTPQPSFSHSPRLGGKRQSSARGVASSSSSTSESLMAPRKLLRLEPSPEAWSCGACTYSNSSLLPYCEMCESPRSASAPKSVLCQPVHRPGIPLHQGRHSVEPELHPSGHQTNQLGRPARGLQQAPGKSNTGGKGGGRGGGAEVCSGVEQPVSHEAETAPTQRPPLPQPHSRSAATGRRPALTLLHQKVRK
ncbi:unnamed protein product [Tetraodon nigroviridis]|uniref:(spotted green pufferfish) hypothetical protein n=1 Tax=Tetraodon nigroviridis TaxID=99883 RepID=Q4SEC0_TETNG|nr:unnamed protein product [Tetraodon nigroviridis]